eukprot:scaffold4805_cov136-Cylindrotheca_fusiformis.AAC.17
MQPSQESSSVPALRMVIQRYRFARILIEETTVLSVGRKCSSLVVNDISSSASLGLLAYISFSSTATEEKVVQAARTLLNLPVGTLGAWGDGSRAQSMLQLLTSFADDGKESSNGTSPLSIILVPQANLIAKIKKNGKSVQYRDQIAKEKGNELYDLFCETVRNLLMDHQAVCRGGEKPSTSKSIHTINGKSATVDPSIPPNQLFRRRQSRSTEYGSFDDSTGIPLTMHNGDPVTKSARKRMQKQYDAQVKRHEKYLEKQKGSESSPPPEHDPPTSKQEEVKESPSKQLDPSFVQLIIGTFGKRQGLEIQSDMVWRVKWKSSFRWMTPTHDRAKLHAEEYEASAASSVATTRVGQPGSVEKDPVHHATLFVAELLSPFDASAKIVNLCSTLVERKKKRKRKKRRERQTQDESLIKKRRVMGVESQDSDAIPAERNVSKGESPLLQDSTAVTAGQSPERRPQYSFQVDDTDHCETPMDAYRDLLDVLDRLAKSLGKTRSNLKIYDPYFCDGGVKRKLGSLGFDSVINRNRDFYQDIAEQKTPVYDVLITNPPYSGVHMEKLLAFANQNSKKPWLFLLPHFVYTKDYYSRTLSQSLQEKAHFLIPESRYAYLPPFWVQQSKGSTALAKGKDKTAPFPSFWYCNTPTISPNWLVHTFGPSGSIRSKHSTRKLRYAKCTNDIPRDFKGEFDKSKKRPNPKARKRAAKKRREAGMTEIGKKGTLHVK